MASQKNVKLAVTRKTKTRNHATNKPVLHQTVCRGLKSAWLESGPAHGDILLLLHGFPDDAHVWDEQIAQFSNSYRVIAPFVRGAAQSQPANDERRYGLDAISLDNLEILRRVDPSGTRKIFLIGHDLGSLHAWHLAPILADRLKGLVIINGGHPLQMWSRKTNWRQVLKSWYVYLFILPFAPEALLRFFGHFLIRKAHRLSGYPEQHDPGALRATAQAPLLVKQYREIVKSLPAYLRGDRFKLKVPVLAIASDQDRYLEPTSLEELERLTQMPTVRVIAGKHWIQLEQPERINGLLEKFFATC